VEFDLNYHGRVQSGVNRPGLAPNPSVLRVGPANFVGPGFFSPRSVLMPVRVTTHQLSISVPIQ
jgi:hypothetical protein